MSARAWARWQASGTHFMTCVAIAAAMVTLVVFKAGKPSMKFDLTVDPKAAQPIKMLLGKKI